MTQQLLLVQRRLLARLCASDRRRDDLCQCGHTRFDHWRDRIAPCKLCSCQRFGKPMEEPSERAYLLLELSNVEYLLGEHEGP